MINNNTGMPFYSTVGFRQGCQLSHTFFNIYLEKIMIDALQVQDHKTSISIGGRRICNLRFTNDIDLMVGSNQVLEQLTDKLNSFSLPNVNKTWNCSSARISSAWVCRRFRMIRSIVLLGWLIRPIVR